MYRIDDEKTYYMMLPPNLQDTDAECFSYALSKQFKKMVRLAEKLNIWGNLDGLNPKYYDLIAACMNSQYYRSKYSDATKLELIKHAYEMHRYAGTQTAIEALLDIVFEKTQFSPWYDYDGEPYHFKVLVYDILTEDAAELFTDVLKKVKAARSTLDSIEIGREAFQTMHIQATTTFCSKNPRITVDEDGENKALHSIHVGSNIGSYANTAKIEEKWGESSGSAEVKSNIAAFIENSTKAQKVVEDFSDENTIGQNENIASMTFGHTKNTI